MSSLLGSINVNSMENETKQRTLSFKKRESENSNAEQSGVHEKVGKLGKLKSLEIQKNSNHNLLQKLQTPTSSSPWSGNIDFDGAVIKLQKVYTSYWTRRILADCASVVEEPWWKDLESAALTQSSVSFFDSDKAETAVSRWERARIRAAKVGKGLSKDKKAQKLALRHWLEAIDPRHRYGHNLHLYYDVWVATESTQPFFYWLDIGDGKEVDLEECPRTHLQHQCIEYLGPKEREAYEVIVENGNLVYKRTRVSVDTPEGSKWIFVLSTSRKFYVGEKKKGLFQHSSFLAGGATVASGRLVARNGILEAIWPFSGHYRPTEENFKEFCSFLEDHRVDLTNVERSPIDDDIPPKVSSNDGLKLGANVVEATNTATAAAAAAAEAEAEAEAEAAFFEGEQEPKNKSKGRSNNVEAEAEAGSGRSCGRGYATQMQFHALEQLNLSPRINPPPPPPPPPASNSSASQIPSENSTLS